MNIYTTTIWLTLLFISTQIKDRSIRYRAKEEKVKIVLILLTGYYIIYFLSGLIYGYSNTPYSTKLIEILKNIFLVLGIRLIQEFVRTKLIKNRKSKKSYVIITLIFAVVNIQFKEVSSTDQLIKFILSEVLPKIAESSLLSYLSYSGGYFLNYSYTILQGGVIIFVPVFPDMDWLLDSILKYVTYLLIFLFVGYENTIRVNRTSRKELRTQTPFKSLPIIIIEVLVVCFITGLFTYRPVAIISNSMYPEFARGDAVIVEKYKNQNIQVNDIIEYELRGRLIVHRVVKIEKQILNTEYITKGDNNKESDLLNVQQSQIVGIVKYKIPYIGYPSVWFSEIFLSK